MWRGDLCDVQCMWRRGGRPICCWTRLCWRALDPFISPTSWRLFCVIFVSSVCQPTSSTSICSMPPTSDTNTHDSAFKSHQSLGANDRMSWGRVHPPQCGGQGLCPQKMFDFVHANLYIFALFDVVCLDQHCQLFVARNDYFWRGDGR